MFHSHSRRELPNYARPGPQPAPLPRTFRFHYVDTEEGIGHIIDRQAANGRPVNLDWLTKAHQHRDTISIQTLELDTAQDLLLLVHYGQPHRPGAKGITVYPIQLSNPVIPDSHRMSIAHRRARKAAIPVKWDGDRADGDTVVVEPLLCGDHVALFVRFAVNQRAVICNWKTGEQVAKVDMYSDLHAQHLVPSPLDVREFAWLTPRIFMISANQQQYIHSNHHDGLYIYELSGDAQQPFSRSVLLEVPRWQRHLRANADGGNKMMTFVTGSFDEDIYPGALSGNLLNRVTVLKEDTYDSSCNLFYVIRNDYLVNHILPHHNGQVLRWEQWALGRVPCVRAFDLISWNNSKQFSLQVCGWKVLTVDRDYDQKTVRTVTVYDFNPAALDPYMTPGTVATGGSKIADSPNSVFKNGCVWSNLPYRFIPILHRIEWGTKFELGTDRLFYTQDENWENVGYIPVQAHHPEFVYNDMRYYGTV